MNHGIAVVLIVMTLAVLAAFLPAAPDEEVSLAATHDESSGAASTRAAWN